MREKKSGPQPSAQKQEKSPARRAPAEAGHSCTLIDVIGTLARHKTKPAILFFHGRDAEKWSYADLLRRTDELARRLVNAGLKDGDTVALSANNRPEWIAACLAVIGAGAVVVPIDAQVGNETFAHVLQDSGAKFIVIDAAGVERLQGIRTSSRLRPIRLDDSGADGSSRKQPAASHLPLPDVRPDDPAVLFYTSGTTGPPKGVPLTHANLAFQVNAALAAKLVQPNDRLLPPLPLHHVYPFVIGMLGALALGVAIVMPHSLTGPQIADAVRGGNVTLIIGVPRLYAAFYQNLRAQFAARGHPAAVLFRAGVALTTAVRRRFNLRLGRLLKPLHRRIAPGLRMLISGGAALDPELALRLEGLGWQVATGYGLTETSPMLTWNRPGASRFESAGKPIPGVELRIEPLKEQEAEPDKPNGYEIGEILVRGPGVFAGYRNLPEKTKDAFASDGWFRTGDLGFIDRDGYLHITGRVSTMIVTEGGKHVQPDELEEAYLASPAIKEIGILQKQGRLVAVIVPASKLGRGKDAEKAVGEALRACARKLRSYERLSDFAITHESLPRTRLGKPQRHRLEERFDRAKKGDADAAKTEPASPTEMSAEDRQLLQEPIAREVWKLLAERYAGRRLTPDSNPQLDLGIDSVEWLNISLEIGQRTGVELSEEAIARIETVRDLLREASEASAAGEKFKTSILDDPEAHLNREQKRWLRPLRPWQSRIAVGLYLVNRALFLLGYRLRVEGRERLPDQPILLSPTHGSLLDPFVLCAALDRDRLAHTYWAGITDWAFGNPLTRAFSRVTKTVPIDQQRGFISGIALGAAVLKRGQSLVWFPEGQRARTPEVQEFMPGIGILLERFPVPVVPVAIHGAHQAMPPGRILPRLGRITVVFGEPLDPAVLEREGEGDQPRHRITEALHRRTVALYNQTRPQ